MVTNKHLVRGDMGRTIGAYRKKKDALNANKYLREWHLGETDGCFNGLEEIDLQ